jgi:hypothetical protein
METWYGESIACCAGLIVGLGAPAVRLAETISRSSSLSASAAFRLGLGLGDSLADMLTAVISLEHPTVRYR